MSNIWAIALLLLASFNPLFVTNRSPVHPSGGQAIVSVPQSTTVQPPKSAQPTTPSAPQASITSGAPVKNQAPVMHTASQPIAQTPAPKQPPVGNSGIQPCVSDPTKAKDPCPPDPNRPYYDMWGNKFDYMGNLIWAACPNQPDPITGKDNPYCVCPANTDQGVYFIRGNDKNTNSVVCGFGYYHECPYAEAVSADDPLCQKLGAEAGK